MENHHFSPGQTRKNQAHGSCAVRPPGRGTSAERLLRGLHPVPIGSLERNDDSASILQAQAPKLRQNNKMLPQQHVVCRFKLTHHRGIHPYCGWTARVRGTHLNIGRIFLTMGMSHGWVTCTIAVITQRPYLINTHPNTADVCVRREMQMVFFSRSSEQVFVS